METFTFSTKSDLEACVVTLLMGHLMQEPAKLHVLPTGNTYAGVYGRAIELLRSSEVQSDFFRQLIIANLDEYIENQRPLQPDDPRSFAAYMSPFTDALKNLGFREENHLFPHSPYREPLTPYMELTKFDELLTQYTCESVFLGLGPRNSPHIAFCGPGFSAPFEKSWFELGSFVGPVDSATRSANADNPGMRGPLAVPDWAVTMSPGILLKLRPRYVYLVAYGPNKDLSVLNSPLPVNENPASVLHNLERAGSMVRVMTLGG